MLRNIDVITLNILSSETNGERHEGRIKTLEIRYAPWFWSEKARFRDCVEIYESTIWKADA